jgi:hypothetical protein
MTGCASVTVVSRSTEGADSAEGAGDFDSFPEVGFWNNQKAIAVARNSLGRNLMIFLDSAVTLQNEQNAQDTAHSIGAHQKRPSRFGEFGPEPGTADGVKRDGASLARLP